MRGFLVTTAAILLAAPALADEPDVVDAAAERAGDGSWRFEVTVSHADEGWDHYADRWEVLSPDGSVLGVRELAHPHVDEQPFTRSLSGVEIPDELSAVRIRARDSVHGYGQAVELELPD